MPLIDNCHLLGATARYNAFYGQGTGPVIIGDIACTGLESSLFDCPNILFGQYCHHSDDVGVVCLPGITVIQLLVLYKGYTF